MAAALLREETATEFFREQLARAMEHQQVSTSAFTEFYLVNLLATCLRAAGGAAREPGFDETPLAVTWVRALRAARAERARLLRAMGDTALFTAGFFADSLTRRLVDFDYYRAMGGRAYARLSEDEPPAGFGAHVFGELAGRFTQFSDVLAEVSESTRVATQQSIVKLYERWTRTGSRRAARLLAERGITPLAPADVRLQ
jgi:hypothetical protein